jgi:hypothetical protein
VNHRLGWVVVLVAIAGLTAVWRVLPAGSPPIYDGNCIADPYRLLGGSPAPQAASMTYPASKAFPTSEVFTGETPPQAQVLMQPGTFASGTAVTVSIAPAPAPAEKPENGVIEGNVYRIAAVTPAGAELEPKTGTPVTVVLRATRSVPPPIIDRFNGTTWTPIATFNSGCGNTFEIASTQMGVFAAVGPAAGAQQPSGSGGGIPAAAIVGGLAVLLLVAIIALFSLDRGRRRAG